VTKIEVKEPRDLHVIKQQSPSKRGQTRRRHKSERKAELMDEYRPTSGGFNNLGAAVS